MNYLITACKFVGKNSGAIGGGAAVGFAIWVSTLIYDLADKAMDKGYNFSIDGDGIKLSKPAD